MRTASVSGFAFLPVYHFNLLYFRGERDRGAFQVPVTLYAW